VLFRSIVQPHRAIGIGVFAEKRAQAALVDRDLPVGRILHPSPASPAANQNWAGKITETLASYGLDIPNPNAIAS